jgi:hypothetical protein
MLPDSTWPAQLDIFALVVLSTSTSENHVTRKCPFGHRTLVRARGRIHGGPYHVIFEKNPYLHRGRLGLMYSKPSHELATTVEYPALRANRNRDPKRRPFVSHLRDYNAALVIWRKKHKCHLVVGPALGRDLPYREGQLDILTCRFWHG